MTIGIYIGQDDDDAENVEKQLLAWGEYLSDYDIEFFGSGTIPESIKERHQVREMKSRTSTNPLKKIYNVTQQVMEYIREVDPYLVIQIWAYPTHAPGVSIACELCSTLSIVRFSGDHFEETSAFSGINFLLAYGLHNILGRIPLQLADATIVLGPHGFNEVTKRGASNSSVYMLPPAIGLETRFSPPANQTEVRQDLGLSTEKKVILYVGRLSKRKGMPFLIEAIKQLPNPEQYEFVIIGDGDYQSEFIQMQNTFNITLPGYIPYTEVHKYYQSSDLYVHPSPYEGIPLTILEALSCGVSVIARDAGDISFVTDEIVNTPSELANRINSPNLEMNWKNKDKFKKEFQSQQLHKIIDNLGNVS